MGPCTSSNNKNKSHNADNHIHKVSTMKDDVEKTILQCKLTRDNVKSYIKRLERNEIQRRDRAKQALKTKDRDRAKIFLSQSKMYREQIKSASGQLVMIEDQIMHIESAKQQAEAVKVLEAGNKALKSLYEEVNVEKWEKIADDMSEIKQQQEEIGNFLKNRGIDQQEYEEEIDKEIESLMKQESNEIEMALPEPIKKEEKVHIKEAIKDKEEDTKVAIPN
jgi:hypothetical protein